MSAPHPLSPAQALFWGGQKLAGDAPLYNMAWRFDLHLALDPALFAQAFQDVANGSEAMRARFFEEDASALQTAGDIPAFATPVTLEPAALDAHLAAMIHAPFDLSQSSYRTALIKLAPDHWVWVFVQHHIACDAQAGAVLARRVSARYEALLAGNAGACDPQHSYFETIVPMDLPSRPTENSGSFPYGAQRGSDARSERVDVEFEASTLNALAQTPAFRLFTPDLTRYALYLTTYLAFLARVTGDETIAIGTPSHNRMNEQTRDMIGLFVEVLPIEVSVDPEDSFQSLHAKVKLALGAFLRNAKPGAVASEGGPGFAHILNYIQASFDGFAGAPMDVEWIHPGAHDAQHALRLHVTDFGATSAAKLSMDVNTAVLNEVAAEGVADHFSRFAAAALAQPDAPLAKHALGGDALSQMDGPAQDQPSSVLHQIMAQAAQSPDAVALVQGDVSLSYGALMDRAARLAGQLASNGLRTGDAVVLHVPRSFDYVIGALGALMAGGHFVPVAISNPAARVSDIVTRAKAAAVITDLAHSAIFDGLDTTVLAATSDHAPLEGTPPKLDSTAYQIFTSGSTGTPKGVAVSHGGLARYIDWAAREFGGPDYPLFTSISFDLTITSLFVPLTKGGRLVIYPEAETGPDMAVLDVFADDKVDTVKLTPAHLSLACQTGQSVTRINSLVLGGENLSVGLCRKAQDVLGDLRILNEYGPTEAVVGCMLHRFDRARDTGPSVPVGHPADGISIALRDAGQNLVPQGVVGEICISGRLAQGYSDPDQTAAKFVTLPPRSYLSGDLGRLRPDGVLEYLGRADMQAKQRGVRIEPAEIETALLGLAGVEAAFVGQPTRPEQVKTCVKCGLASDYPEASFDAEGACHICSQFDSYKDRAQAYFAPPDELTEKIKTAHANRTGKYDAIMLLSGGKDSTYAAYRLAELTGDVLALTLDNGFLSDGAMANVKRVTDDLGWDQQFLTTPAMNDIFVDSLKRHSNVCQGCFKTVYTLALREARAQGIPAIVTGLSRGQFFETRLTPELFQQKAPTKDELEAMVLDARHRYHAEPDAISTLLDTSDLRDGSVLGEVEIIDLYRYIDVPVSEIYRYLSENAPWRKPDDTGRSTNCLINDLGIYFHRKREGFHNYALPYSWDVRMGHKTRNEALDELNDEIDIPRVEAMLEQIGFDEPIKRTGLVAYVKSSLGEAAIWDGLRRALPAEMLPSGLVIMDQIPLTPNGKVDTTKLSWPRGGARAEGATFTPPETETEAALATIIAATLAVSQVGLHDDFFDLGMDSLAAVKIAMAANEAGFTLPTSALFDHRSLAGLARYADEISAVTPAPTAAADDDDLLDLDALDLDGIGKVLT